MTFEVCNRNSDLRRRFDAVEFAIDRSTPVGCPFYVTEKTSEIIAKQVYKFWLYQNIDWYTFDLDGNGKKPNEEIFEVPAILLNCHLLEIANNWRRPSNWEVWDCLDQIGRSHLAGAHVRLMYPKDYQPYHGKVLIDVLNSLIAEKYITLNTSK